jgi:signal transduction histidine kinase
LTEPRASKRRSGTRKGARTREAPSELEAEPPRASEDEDTPDEHAREDSGASTAALAEQTYLATLQAKPWRERQTAIELMIEELQTKPEPATVRTIAERMLALTADPKWEVRLSLCRGLVYLTHPLFQSIADALEQDHNNFVSKTARQAADRRRELDREYQRKTDEIDVVHGELEGLRREHGERVAAAAERLAEHKYKLLTNETTHEMRTVVAGLLDALGKLQGNLESSRTAKKHWERNLSIALDRTKFLKRMLDDTKKLVDDPKPELEDADLSEMLHKVVGLVRDALHVPPEVRFEIDLGTRPGTHLHVPRVRLIQALSSLAKNAIEAVEGKGRVVLRTSHVARRGWVEIAVIDTGYGMDREEIRRALLPMVSTKKDDQHTGVGLPLARKIIERECRGEFVIESEPDKGTTVRCLLPEALDGES